MTTGHGKFPDIVVGAKILSLCMKKPCDVEELTRKIYSQFSTQGVGKIYRAIEILCKEGILKPVFNSRQLKYKYDEERKDLS